MAEQSGKPAKLDSLSAVQRLAEEVRRVATATLLEFGAAVRADEEAKVSDSLCLLRTIGANIDNDRLSDEEFREFVRKSMKGRVEGGVRPTGR